MSTETSRLIRGKNAFNTEPANALVKEDREVSTAEPSRGRGTGVLSPALEKDACLLHEDDSDQSKYSCASPTIDRGDDDLEDSVASSPQPQVWFDRDTLPVMYADTASASSQSGSLFH